QHAAEEATVATDGELAVLLPQPVPVFELARGLDQEVVDARRPARRRRLWRPPGAGVGHRDYSSRTTVTVISAMTSGFSSTRTWWSPRVLMPPSRSMRRRSTVNPLRSSSSPPSLAVTEP